MRRLPSHDLRGRSASVAALVVAAVWFAAPAGPVAAQTYGRAPMAGSPAESQAPVGVREVSIEQNLGAQVPLDATFTDETGRRVTLAELGEGKPILLVPAYYECPMLCSLVINGVMTSISTLKFDAGREFEVVVVSIDPEETVELAADAKERFRRRYNRDAADGLHFLTGDEAAIHSVMDPIGFRYAYQPETDEWAHAAGIFVLTPEGTVARYFYGVEYPPRDLRLGLVEAADGSIGSPVDEVLLYCFHYDPTTGKYSAAVLNILRLAGILTLVAIGLYFLLSRRRSLTTSLGKA